MGKAVSWSIVVTITIVSYCSKLPALKTAEGNDQIANEKPHAQHSRLQKEALSALGQTCTNEVVGLRLIIRQSMIMKKKNRCLDRRGIGGFFNVRAV